jgi:hypothetical protein
MLPVNMPGPLNSMLLKNLFILNTQKYSLQGKCCPVNINTIEEPIFFEQKVFNK